MAQPQIVLYGHEGCPGSRAAEVYFRQHRMNFTKKDIGTDAQAQAEFMTLGGFATPLIVVDGRLLLGFDPAEFDPLRQGIDGRGSDHG